jgi:hypothetical protein
MIPFSFVEECEPLPGTLWYSADEGFCFDVEIAAYRAMNRRGPMGCCCLCIDHIQLDVGLETGYLVEVYGWHPPTVWRQSTLPAIETRGGIVKAHLDRGIERGTGMDLVPPCTWPTTYDAESGWICFGRPDPSAELYVEFCTSTVAGLADGVLQSLWLRPQIRGPLDSRAAIGAALDSSGRLKARYRRRDP